MNSIFHRLKKLKKVNSIFLARSQRSQHTNSTFFACLNKLHNIQSNFLQFEKDAKIVFVFMKNGFIIWGASALRLSGPFGPAPIWWIHFSWKQKLFLRLFQFAKSWIECCVTCSTMQKKVEFVCCERCDLGRKIEFTFFWAFWACEKLNLSSISFFFIAKNCVSNKLFFLNKRPVRYK